MSDKFKTPNSALTSTRQLLDELDALMEDMLSLPVDDATRQPQEQKASATSVADAPPETEEPSAETPPQREEENKAQPETNYLYDEAIEDHAPPSLNPAAEEIVPPQDEENEADLSALQPSRLTGEIMAPLTNTEQVNQPAHAMPILLPEPLARRSQLLAQHHPWRRLWLWPLSAINRAFDGCTYALGPFGNWLRQPAGRTFVGFLGVMLILAAVCIRILMWLSWN